jgi:O-antigen/teichoic acid export membrane protein
MRRLASLRRGGSGVLMANVGARVAALVSLAVATLLVARAGGPAAVGAFALLRVLPGLFGVVLSAGLPGAVAYFLAGPRREDRRLPLTIVAIALGGGALGTALWTAASPVLQPLFFDDFSVALVILAGVTVLAQLLVATATCCSQGTDDLPGANIVIVNEELPFLPIYGLLLFAGIHGNTAVVAGMLLADVAAFVPAWTRLYRRGFFRAAARPSLTLGREVVAYGTRGQVGGVITLMNLRLDFILLQLMAGPAVLGVYAIASKFAELVKVLSLALNYVLYPQFARDGAMKAADRARRLLPKGVAVTAAAAVPLMLSAGVVVPLAYGDQFASAVVPAQILLLGLTLDGAAGVLTGYLYGVGRPGTNSLAMAAGLVVTVVLDLVLIPPFAATGAAIASAVAYLTSTLMLGFFFWSATRRPPAGSQWTSSTVPGVETTR